MPNTALIVSWPVGSDDARPVPGSTIGRCSKCNCEVYLSPSSQKLIELLAPPVICAAHALTRLEQLQKSGEEVISKWSDDGLADLLKKGN